MTRPETDPGSGGSPREPLVLGDRYELVEPLGHGGMAEVHRALDRALDRVVAVKLLPADQRHDSTQSRRLHDEARAAAGLSHPHVVPVHDVGWSSQGVYVVMELLDGRPWRQRIAECGPLPERESVGVAAAVASALAHAHARGTTHRDVNPANVMLLADGTPILMDFGIAQLAHAGGLTETGAVVGTPTYMSPEQVRGEELDGRSDVYSLGCALYEALTGTPPFRGTGSADVASVRLREAPVPPRALRPELSVAVEDLVMRTLSVDRSARPDAATLTEALRDLGPAVPTQRSSSSRPGPVGDADAPSGEPPAADAPAPGAGRLHRVGSVLVVLGLLALVVVCLVLFVPW
ncbi:serine/threonine-protein kinase [Actinomycetospora sp. TBRC 11914]|uniref:serine/threonine-protein kinase n=1 Tax=Actinomycetospora sp. TBRC 11914 TaxID=2729387 RepID=UPI00145D0E50|nr:serine/threonine-protein kinase [Actinomycetospora sp. TBRC 11914]NMO93589.1 serine/threonine protein kinase [Actinomycetospora sp. TBRC 11914]